jgi:hypothetical protein
MSGCSACNAWVHHECSGLTEEQARDKVKHFYCRKCREEKGLVHEWHAKIPTPREAEMKRKHYHEVEKIIGHRLTAHGRMFTVKWKGYSKPDTLPEKCLDGCLDLLQDYCLANKLHLSKIQGLVGASNKHVAKLNPKNWKTLECIAECISLYRQYRARQSCLPVIIFDTGLNQDGVYLIKHDFHCYVALYVNDSNTMIIADGTNDYIHDRQVAKELKNVLDTDKQIRAIKYQHQLKRDHCASSAVLIALEFLRIHLEGHNMDELKSKDVACPKWLRKRVVAKMHKFESQALIEIRGPIKILRSYQTCNFCGTKFTKSDRRYLNIHIRFKCPARVLDLQEEESSDKETIILSTDSEDEVNIMD